jgi:hypothetical protein
MRAIAAVVQTLLAKPGTQIPDSDLAMLRRQARDRGCNRRCASRIRMR